MKFLNVQVEDKLHLDVKILAVKQEKTLIEIVNEALTDLLKKNQKDD